MFSSICLSSLSIGVVLSVIAFRLCLAVRGLNGFILLSFMPLRCDFFLDFASTLLLDCLFLLILSLQMLILFCSLGVLFVVFSGAFLLPLLLFFLK